MRINKFLALAGLGSRRKVEQYILDEQISVNGKVITNLAFDIKDGDKVCFNGQPINVASKYEYYMLNKPKGYITTNKEQFDRKTVIDLLTNVKSRVFPVGRLDYDTEGLLLLTNDGDLANRLMKPNFQIEKTYDCVIEGQISESELAVLRAGVTIDGKKLNKCKVKVKESKDNKTKLQITINQGMNRQIRKMMEVVGKNVVRLNRIKIGELKLGGLSRGEYRPLRDFEIDYLYYICKMV